MGASRKKNDAYLIWLVGKRNKSQLCCLNLLALLKKHQDKINSDNLSLLAQELVGAAFSLWRAVFLAEKESKKGIPLSHATKFLEKVVRTNAIAFSQELDANEWAFNYYLHNARYRLERLKINKKPLMAKWSGTRKSATDRWDYCQSKLEEAMENFAKHLNRTNNG